MEQSTRDKLFSVVRAGMGLPAAEITLSSDECLSILKLSNRQSILPIVLRGMDKLGIADPSQALFEQHRLKSDYRVIQHDDALRRVSSALDEAGIPYIPLKGAVLRHLYPDITLRTSSDIDVLVKETDLDKAVAVLEEKTDFKTDKRNYHDVSMISSRVHLELHFTIKENSEGIDQVLEKAWNYANPSDKGSQYEFAPEFMLFHIVAHMSHHFLHGGLGIRPFLDLWLFRNKKQFDESKTIEMLSACGILQFYKECCHLSDIWMKGEEHTDTSRLFESFCLSGGVFGNEKFKIAGTQRRERGWRYIVSRVFPPKYQVMEHYKEIDGKKHATAYYYVKRWRRWVGKDKRSELKYQMKANLQSDKKYQDSADELFKRLGL